MGSLAWLKLEILRKLLGAGREQEREQSEHEHIIREEVEHVKCYGCGAVVVTKYRKYCASCRKELEHREEVHMRFRDVTYGTRLVPSPCGGYYEDMYVTLCENCYRKLISAEAEFLTKVKELVTCQFTLHMYDYTIQCRTASAFIETLRRLRSAGYMISHVHRDTVRENVYGWSGKMLDSFTVYAFKEGNKAVKVYITLKDIIDDVFGKKTEETQL